MHKNVQLRQKISELAIQKGCNGQHPTTAEPMKRLQAMTSVLVPISPTHLQPINIFSLTFPTFLPQSLPSRPINQARSHRISDPRFLRSVQSSYFNVLSSLLYLIQ